MNGNELGSLERKVEFVERIKLILENEGYKRLSYARVCRIARREFCKFDDDVLKIRFLTKCFENMSEESLGKNTPESCARCLVEGGTFEKGWRVR